jgi:mono/diheme cytochrome c family protein
MKFPALMFGLIAGLSILASTSIATAQSLDAESVKLPEMTPRLNLGKMNYEGYCASCHGRNAAGTDKGPTFLHRVYHPGHHGDAAFMIAPQRGARAHHWRFGDMPPVEGVTDEQLETIVEYVRALQKVNGLF